MHLNDLEILNRATSLTHVAGHLFAFDHVTWRGACPDGTRPAAPTAGTVRGSPTTKVPPLDDTLKAASLGLSNHVDEIASLEHVGPDRVTGIDVQGEVTKFLDAPDWRDGALVPRLAVG